MKLYKKTWGRPWIGYEYRCDPVPYVRCHRGAHYGHRYLRYPKTTQERRAYFLTEDELYYGVRLRARRSIRGLPNAWDDYYRGDIHAKNWKKYRRTQYK